MTTLFFPMISLGMTVSCYNGYNVCGIFQIHSKQRQTVFIECPVIMSTIVISPVINLHPGGYPENAKCYPNAGLMLGQRRGRWSNIKLTLVLHFVSISTGHAHCHYHSVSTR